MATNPTSTGPHPPIPTVRYCDIGGERLRPDAGWWLVTEAGRSWLADRGAACAEHGGREPVVYAPPPPRIDEYGRAVASQREVASDAR